MSRLDSFIRRLEAQRACLDHAAAAISGIAGPVLELGLGNGRTYDHLRQVLPDRSIYVFERAPAAHPDCMPPDDHLIVGDFSETLPQALGRIGQPAAFVHIDCGSGDAVANDRLAALLGPLLPPILAAGGLVASDQALTSDALAPIDVPPQAAHGRYFLYRRSAGPSG